MSLQQSEQLRHHIGLPWKTFVRECGDPEQTTVKKHAYQLGFRDNEAKAAYEEIISHESNKLTVTLKKKYYKSNAGDSQSNSVAKPASDNSGSKVTVNSILKAVEQKDLKFLQKHVTLDNVNSSDDFGWTPLMSAAYCGHLEIVQFLLNFGANRKARERSGLTAAQLALKKNYLGIVALLKKKIESTANRAQTSCTLANVHNETMLPLRTDMAQSLEDCKDVQTVDVNKPRERTENTRFYCDICKAHFQETTVKKHESSTLHIFNSKPKLPNAVYGISKQNKGYQILLNSGWEEDCGLGPSGKGIKYPIKTFLKTDRKGIGQLCEKEARVTHFKPGDVGAIGGVKVVKQKPLKKRDREKLISREARKERALRIALS